MKSCDVLLAKKFRGLFLKKRWKKKKIGRNNSNASTIKELFTEWCKKIETTGRRGSLIVLKWDKEMENTGWRGVLV